METVTSSNPSKSAKVPGVKRQIHPIIEIVDGSKHYGFCGQWRQVLRKLNMTVDGGEVYALLGPHGCGKSTVLNVILGLISLDMGQVTIFGFKPGHELSGIPGIRVGYTPQSSGLYQDFTIHETLRYYGALLQLDRQYISQRIVFLNDLLAMPNDEQIVRNCTEGTKRQISFAVALLHEPDLLILDEPCAGIDPVLRRSMWEYMKQLAKEDKTILITTQSCEEARWADKVGFMRNGHLLIEGNPKELLRTYKEKVLETLYRRVYISNLQYIRPTASIEENPLIKLEPLNVTSSEGFIYTGEEESSTESLTKRFSNQLIVQSVRLRNLQRHCLSLKRLCVLLTHNFLLAIRNYDWLILFLIVPSLFLVVYCYTIGTTPTSLNLAIVNYEASTKQCLSNYKYFLSCQLLDLIDSNIIVQRTFVDEEEASRAAHNLEVSAVLVIHKRFSTYINKVLAEIVLGRDDAVLEQPPIVLSLDTTSRIVANTIEHTIKHAFESYIERATRGTKVEGTLLGYPLKIQHPIFGSESTTDTDYMAPGFIVAFTYHSAAFVAAVALVTDRVKKIAQRNYLAGVQLKEVVISQMIVNGLLTLIQAVLLFCVLFVVFDMPNQGSLVVVCCLVMVHVWCGISFGVLMAMISKTNVTASLYIFCSVVATLILCGVQWPLYGLPRWLHVTIEYLPQTQAIEAVRTVLQRGTSITHRNVWMGIVVPGCWMCVFTLGYMFTNKII